MKYLFFFVALFCLVNCQEKQEEKDAGKRFFNADKLDELNINNLTGFFGTEELRTYASPFKNCYGYVDGIGYENSLRYENNGMGIFVTVFESQEKALECMQNRINSVACVIEKGVTNEIDGIWWFTDCFPNAVFKNQWNTIIEVYRSDPDFENIKSVLLSEVNEVAGMVDKLSNVIEE
jgi:hypothetical protein